MSKRAQTGGCPAGQHTCGTTYGGQAICCPNPNSGGTELSEQYQTVRKASKKMTKNRIARRKNRSKAKRGADLVVVTPTKQFRNQSHATNASSLYDAIRREKILRARVGCGTGSCGY